MASYATRVRADIVRWTELGLIDRPTAQAIARDIEARERASLSFGGILMIMAALLFGAAVLLLVAANWEAFPRIGRVALLFAVIAGGYVGGAILKGRGHPAIAEGFWLVAAAAFGGSIALIGQMYHLSGDEAQAILTWCFGTAIAAVALRSGPLTLGAAAIGASWMVTEGFRFWQESSFPLFYLAIAAALWLVSYWTHSRAARHFLLLSIVFYLVLYGIDFGLSATGLLMAIVAVGLFAAAILAPEAVERVVRLSGRLPLHALIAFLAGAAMLQADIVESAGLLAISALVVFAAIAAAVVLAGRESRGLRWVAYLGFSLELCFVYVATVGTMLGTAGLFLASGLALAVVAFIIIQIEKRLSALSPTATGAV